MYKTMFLGYLFMVYFFYGKFSPFYLLISQKGHHPAEVKPHLMSFGFSNCAGQIPSLQDVKRNTWKTCSQLSKPPGRTGHC